MSPSQEKIQSPSYEGGKTVTSRLVKALHLSEYKELTDVLGVGKGTISTWHQREQTPFEIAIRVHLTTGVSLKWLLLGEGEMYEGGKPAAEAGKVELPYFELKNGDLVDKGKMFFDPQFLEGMPEAEHLMLVEHEDQKRFVDTSNTKVISGEYLISYSNLKAVHKLNKLPNGKVFMRLEDKDIEVEEKDFKIIGKTTDS
ncbi:helix-turn-helix domain-containing protein [Photobacterium makurazakiensis]|uniref:phage repressor protein CI n=1 Tax=Photobacterium makurazakiensis TaxID=2910234 RepID=UPI003D10E200